MNSSNFHTHLFAIHLQSFNFCYLQTMTIRALAVMTWTTTWHHHNHVQLLWLLSVVSLNSISLITPFGVWATLNWSEVWNTLETYYTSSLYWLINFSYCYSRYIFILAESFFWYLFVLYLFFFIVLFNNRTLYLITFLSFTVCSGYTNCGETYRVYYQFC